MNEIKVTKWKCEFCGKEFDTPTEREEHENLCRKNPAGEGCLTCNYYSAKRQCGTSYQEHYCGSIRHWLDGPGNVFCPHWKKKEVKRCETCKKSTLVMGIYGYERFCEEIQTTLRDISTKCPLWEGKNV